MIVVWFADVASAPVAMLSDPAIFRLPFTSHWNGESCIPFNFSVAEL